MIEKLVNSKTRLKLLKLFLSNINNRYYLRELERLLDESLSPLRRQLVKLTDIGILIVEEEANLKYYRLNRNFERLDELKRIVLEEEVLDSAASQLHSNNIHIEDEAAVSHSDDEVEMLVASPKQFRYDVALLSFISIFVLITAIFVLYTNMKSIKQVADLISGRTVLDSAKYSSSEVEKNILPRSKNIRVNTGNSEMASKKWKILPGNVPVFSSGETDEEEKPKEL